MATARTRESLDAVLLDAGGVLLLPDPDAFRRALSPYGITPDDATCHRGHFEAMHEADRLHDDGYKETNRFLARWFGVPEHEVDEAAAAIEAVYLQQRLLAIPGVTEELARLRDAGLALAIVSNASGTMEAQLAEHRICSVDGRECVEVAVVIDSEVVGVAKPDPAIFGLALEALGKEAARSVFVGDSAYFDVGGATAAGIAAVHLDPYGLCDGRDHHAHADSLAAFTDELLGPGETGHPL